MELSVSDVYNLFVHDQNGFIDPCVDFKVYGIEQDFRMFMCTKTDEERPLRKGIIFKKKSETSVISEVLPKDISEIKVDHEHLIKEWQDWVLANAVAIYDLNILMVFASRQDFPFTIPADYSVKYVQTTSSFKQTMSQLSTEMRKALTDAREDLNRVHTGMEDVPGHLNLMVTLIRQAPYDLFLTLFPDSFNEIEKLVNNSLVVLRKPEKKFEQVLNLLTEIDYLLNVTSTDQIISLQVYDVKTQWTLLTELVIELAKQAEKTRESFLLQFNWILKEFIRPDFPFVDTHRDFILLLLMPKIIELDQISDLLGIITKTYTDISFQFTDVQIASYAHLLLLTEEKVRKQYLSEFRFGLSPVAVQIARLAMKQHIEFLQRDKNRSAKYE